ncbi:MAG: PEP-CTERM sorting domain-containing protein, partial [Terriglobales bacterium]
GNIFQDGPDGWLADATPNSDGFSGTFGSGASDSGGTDTTVVFTLLGAPVYADGEDPTWIVHIRYDFGDNTNCSAFISNAPTPGGSVPADGSCGGTEIPEPGSLALLGTGLFSAVGVIRRKLKKA